MVFTLEERKVADLVRELGDAVESMEIERIASMFTEDCRIKILNVELEGREGVRAWLNWLFRNLVSISFESITAFVKDNIFYEEFLVIGTMRNDEVITSRQAEIIEVDKEEMKIKSLRLYFDSMDFIDSLATDPITRWSARRLRERSREGLH
ncbi:MAG: hypothetical protein BAJATHORv1_20530 [Candidatus Thorarchaeota archaeon]|nr:MAG: hypothetical protein BAJATHORv1_20530 [Candidatus Thorarchaeota archaeon]